MMRKGWLRPEVERVDDTAPKRTTTTGALHRIGVHAAFPQCVKKFHNRCGSVAAAH